MERHITEPGRVLDAKGRITPGWSERAVLTYRRDAIRAPFYRIKEWDYYQVSDGEKCLQFTFGHASYAGQAGVMLFDFKKGEKIADISRIIPLPFASLNLPENAEADSDVCYDRGGVHLRFNTKGDTRLLSFSAQGFEACVTLERKNPYSTVVNIPFDSSPTAFYYNQKINCMEARGRVLANGKSYLFSDGAYGLLDWGRGVWPFHNEWYWSNGTGLVDGELFGFNLGCGFGNTSGGTENMLFWRGGYDKLGAVRIECDKSDYMRPWRIFDEEGRLELTMTPSYDRTTRMKVLFVDNCCHQVFGTFEGRAVLSDGAELRIRDVEAFAEHAVNNW